MDKRSQGIIFEVDPALAALVRAAAATLEAQGTFLCVYQGLRTAEQQNALYAQGRTTPGHIVTNAKAGYSNHNYGLAIDVVPYLAGDGGALNWNPKTEQYQAMVTALKAQGLEWGGDWTHFPDMDHFQMKGIPANPSAAMMSDYQYMSLERIWEKAATGQYGG